MNHFKAAQFLLPPLCIKITLNEVCKMRSKVIALIGWKKPSPIMLKLQSYSIHSSIEGQEFIGHLLAVMGKNVGYGHWQWSTIDLSWLEWIHNAIGWGDYVNRLDREATGYELSLIITTINTLIKTLLWHYYHAQNIVEIQNISCNISQLPYVVWLYETLMY